MKLKMKLIIATITLIIFIQTGYSQPSHKIIEGNLNSISDKDILNLLSDNSADYDVDVIGLGKIIIDSTTNLDRLHLLSSFEKLDLSIKLDTLPREFMLTKFKAKYLSIDGNHTLLDISSINSFKQVKNLGIGNFSGTQLSKNKLKIKSLVELSLYNLPQIENLNALINLKSLLKLYINDLPKIEKLNTLSNLKSLHTLFIEKTPKLKEFPKMNRRNRLVYLSLRKVGSNLQNLKYLNRLKHLNLEFGISEFPDFLPPNIESLRMKNRSTFYDISNINIYQKLTDVTLSSFSNADSVSTFHSKKLNRLHIENSGDTRSLNFIFSFNKINSLELRNLDRIKNLDCKNCITEFENIQLLGLKGVENFNSIFNCKINNSISIKYTSILSIPKLIELKKVTGLIISENSNLKVEDIYLSENWRIEKNGKLE